MVLTIDDKINLKNKIVFDSTSNLHLEDVYSKCPWLFEEGKIFSQKPCRTFPPESVLYVRQKEDAVTYVGDKLANGKPVQYCGTQDVLTCHVVVLYHPPSRGNHISIEIFLCYMYIEYIVFIVWLRNRFNFLLHQMFSINLWWLQHNLITYIKNSKSHKK